MTLFEEQPGLLQRFRDGDRSAFEALYRRYFSDVFRLFSRGFVTGNPPSSVPGLEESQAQEHLQEVFLRAFDDRARMAYDGLRPYRPYLLRIAKNLRIDVARRERHLCSGDSSGARSRGVDIDRLIEEASPPSPRNLDEELHVHTRLRATRDFVDGLSEVERQFVQLRFVEEHPQASVANQLNITRRKVRSLETSIQQQLLEYLAARGLTT